MGKYVKGDVVLVPFPYSDLSGAKKRPVLVLADLSRDDAIVCQITTQIVNDGYSVEIKNSDLVAGKLLKASYVRPNRLFTVDTNIVENKIGAISPAKTVEVVARILKILS